MKPPRHLHTFHLRITLRAPYLVHGNDPGAWGLDATLLRDAHGCPILPGTLLAGRVAELWLNHPADFDHPDLRDWLGQGGNGARNPHGDDGGRRGRLQVADLRLSHIGAAGGPLDSPWTPAAEQPLTQTRIACDADTGSVRAGAMLVVEQIAPPGTPLTFTGTWHAWATPQEATTLARQLQAALLAQTQIGADRSVGLGVLIDARVSALEPALDPHPIALQKTFIRASCLRMHLQFQEHFCLAERVHNGNLFQGADWISGGAILGALAQTLCHAHGVAQVADAAHVSVLARHFDRLRCTHAHPAHASQPQRPVPTPLSWVWSGNALADAWRCAQPVCPGGTAPAFQPDWKGQAYGAACALTGWADVPHHLRVRTALHDGRAADSALFAYDSRYSPRDASGQPALHWLADLHLPADIDPDTHHQLLQELEHLTQAGLAPIGKTDARASVRWCATAPQALASPADALPSLQVNDLLALRLNSAALLLDAVALTDQPIESAHTAYAQAFGALLDQAGGPGAMTLSHHFAQQRLAGGNALHHRYHLGRSDPQASAYRPLLLTQPGSVFVFTVHRPSELRDVLSNWLANGLPLPPAVAARLGASWQDHPYIAANGFGEVAVHTTQPAVPELMVPASLKGQA